jgi:hypothetical protein
MLRVACITARLALYERSASRMSITSMMLLMLLTFGSLT